MGVPPPAAAPPLPAPNPSTPWQSFRDTLLRFDRSKLAPGMALRNAIGVALPLAIAGAMGSMTGGIVVATGALNVSFSDGRDPYRRRARRMFASSLLVGIAVFIGALTGRNNWLAVGVAAIWAFAAGMLVALGQAPGDLGVTSLVTLIVFAAQPMSHERAAAAGLLAFSGGLLQTFLSIALWPVRRYEPERAALASLYDALANMSASPSEPWTSPPVTNQMNEAQNMLAALGNDHSVEAERYVFLLNQAERIRLSLVTLGRLRRRIARDPQGQAAVEALDRVLATASATLASVGHSMQSGHWDTPLVDFQAAVETFRKTDWQATSPFLAALIRDARRTAEALGGQLRAIATLANELSSASLEGSPEPSARDPWRRQFSDAIAKLVANLSLDSAVFRHAMRLAVCIAAGDALARGMGLRRHYWIPMTIAILLKPDFTATFSRGVLRLGGTFTGLLIATVMFHYLRTGVLMEVVLIALFVFLLRWLGPANFGILTTGVSALVVLLIASTGIKPQEVIAARAVNTAIGGGLALLAYLVWPTWERTQIGETLARMLEEYRDYFRAVIDAATGDTANADAELNATRVKARLARSNAEASVDRVSAEPGVSPQQMSVLKSVLASAHGFVMAVMAMEAGLYHTKFAPPRQATREFAEKVRRTLDALANTLRHGAPLYRDGLPDLREAHNAILDSVKEPNDRYALVNVETDRMTNTLNTLTEQVLKRQALQR